MEEFIEQSAEDLSHMRQRQTKKVRAGDSSKEDLSSEGTQKKVRVEEEVGGSSSNMISGNMARSPSPSLDLQESDMEEPDPQSQGRM